MHFVEDWFSHPLLMSSLRLQLAVQDEIVRGFMATLKTEHTVSSILASKLESHRNLHRDSDTMIKIPSNPLRRQVIDGTNKTKQD